MSSAHKDNLNEFKSPRKEIPNELKSPRKENQISLKSPGRKSDHKPQRCTYKSSGFCLVGESCRALHECYWFKHEGFCHNGATCKFAHPREDEGDMNERIPTLRAGHVYRRQSLSDYGTLFPMQFDSPKKAVVTEADLLKETELISAFASSFADSSTVEIANPWSTYRKTKEKHHHHDHGSVSTHAVELPVISSAANAFHPSLVAPAATNPTASIGDQSNLMTDTKRPVPPDSKRSSNPIAPPSPRRAREFRRVRGATLKAAVPEPEEPVDGHLARRVSLGHKPGTMSKSNQELAKTLKRLRQLWLKAAERGGLNQEEFVQSLGDSYKISRRELETLFKKMDCNSDGTLSWDEYLSYVLKVTSQKWQLRSQRGSWDLVETDEPPIPIAGSDEINFEIIMKLLLLLILLILIIIIILLLLLFS
jgi:hypothetical protein